MFVGLTHPTLVPPKHEDTLLPIYTRFWHSAGHDLCPLRFFGRDPSTLSLAIIIPFATTFTTLRSVEPQSHIFRRLYEPHLPPHHLPF